MLLIISYSINMLIFQLHTLFAVIALISQIAIVITLSVVVVFFSTLLLLGIIKSYKLKKENERLESMSPKIDDTEDKPYSDFTQSHIYDKQ